MTTATLCCLQFYFETISMRATILHCTEPRYQTLPYLTQPWPPPGADEPRYQTLPYLTPNPGRLLALKGGLGG